MRMSARGGSAFGGHPNLRIQKLLGTAGIAFILFLLDRILKYYFMKNSAANTGGVFIPGLLSFHFEKNYGIAFGLPLGGPVLIFLVAAAILILINYLIKSLRQGNLISSFALALIVAGAVSNLIDRLRFGFVVDYIDVPWFTVFNLADVMITAGVGLLIINFWLAEKNGTKAV